MRPVAMKVREVIGVLERNGWVLVRGPDRAAAVELRGLRGGV